MRISYVSLHKSFEKSLRDENYEVKNANCSCQIIETNDETISVCSSHSYSITKTQSNPSSTISILS